MKNPTVQFALRPLAWCAAWVCLGVQAQSALPVTSADLGGASAQLPLVLVSASRQQQALLAVPATANVVSADDLQARQIVDIHDLARDLPNVSVRRGPARYSVTGRGNPTGADGNAGFTIRGQGGNRVVMLVDGVRLPHSYINGSNAFGRDAVALEAVKRIEIVRGASSALYGSDGLAGLVQFFTLQPDDYLSKADTGGRAWAGYNGDDAGWRTGATLAHRLSETSNLLMTLGVRQAQGLRNRGEVDTPDLRRTTPNPQTQNLSTALLKWVWRPDARQQHTATLEHNDEVSEVDLLSSRAVRPFTGSPAVVAAKVVDEAARSHSVRDRVGWQSQHTLDAAWADTVQASLDLQNSHAAQSGYTRRNDQGLRWRDTVYQERTVQLGLQADKALAMAGGWEQTLRYGLEWVRTDSQSLTQGADPAPLPAFGDRKYFPDTRDSSQALYLQSEWRKGDWRWVPGLRVDHFALDVLNTQGYYPGLASQPPTALSGSAVSPKLGVVWQGGPKWSLYGSLSKGFRAPQGSQVNSALEVSTAKLLPNPDLKPETSRSLELGARLREGRLQLDAVVFLSRYDQLIVDKKDLGTANGQPASATNPTLFQTVNIDRATLRGVELQGQWALGTLGGGQLSLPFAWGMTRGFNDLTAQPLNSVDPVQWRLGLQWRTAGVDLGLTLNHWQAKSAQDVESPFVPKSTQLRQFLTPAATVLDAHAQWRLSKALRMQGAITNLTNQKYWRWADVQGLASNADPVVVDAYTQPGRQVHVSLVMDF